MNIEIPLQGGYPFFSFQVVLEEQEYTFRFKWNSRAERWYLTILDVNDVILVAGICVVCNWNLLAGKFVERLPKGTLVAVNTSDNTDPTLSNLGSKVILVYGEYDG